MPRQKRADEAGAIYHALNRGNRRQAIFHKVGDYEAFLRVLSQGLEKYPVEFTLADSPNGELGRTSQSSADRKRTRCRADLHRAWSPFRR